jgi:hypothetical protein
MSGRKGAGAPYIVGVWSLHLCPARRSPEPEKPPTCPLWRVWQASDHRQRRGEHSIDETAVSQAAPPETIMPVAATDRGAKALRGPRLLALFCAGWLLMNFPLLSLFDRDLRLFGLPLLPLALFVGWALLIVALAAVSERGGDD